MERGSIFPPPFRKGEPGQGLGFSGLRCLPSAPSRRGTTTAPHRPPGPGPPPTCAGDTAAAGAARGSGPAARAARPSVGAEARSRSGSPSPAAAVPSPAPRGGWRGPRPAWCWEEEAGRRSRAAAAAGGVTNSDLSQGHGTQNKTPPPTPLRGPVIQTRPPPFPSADPVTPSPPPPSRGEGGPPLGTVTQHRPAWARVRVTARARLAPIPEVKIVF